MELRSLEWLLLALFVAVVVFAIIYRVVLATKTVKVEAEMLPAKPEFIRIAGRLVAKDEWSPEALAAIQKEYFRPAAAKQYLFQQDVTFTCPKGEATTRRVAIICGNADLARSLAENMCKSSDVGAPASAIPNPKGIGQTVALGNSSSRSRSETNCDHCGKRARASARSIIWEGAYETWDGSN